MASRIAQSFSFHQSPESFISSRIQQFASSAAQEQSNARITPIVCAEILNRNVHIITSYKLCKAVLCASEATEDNAEDLTSFVSLDNGEISALPPTTFAAGPAYEQLMKAFFPAPNLLLEDGERHIEHKKAWRTAFASVVEASVPLIRNVTLQSFIEPSLMMDQGTPAIDLYDKLKTLVWDILFAIFMGMSRDDPDNEFRTMENLQESVLRGQFSLFPLSLRTPFWTSARSRGLEAVRDLGPRIRNRLRSRWGESSSTVGKSQSIACPFAERIRPAASGSEPLSEDDIVAHVRLFTSSIANKALASLLTAFLMNTFLWRSHTMSDRSQSIANLIVGQPDPLQRNAMLQSVLQETLRLSPPVIGVMRRVTQTVSIKDDLGPDDDDHDDDINVPHTIPAGHDAWLYFTAANRDPTTFDSPEDFRWDRFMQSDDSTNHGIAFGLGAKRCLGATLTHQIALTVAQTVLDSGVSLRGKVDEEEGVKQWLGWQSSADAGMIARDLKQLPCQRPRKPVMVTMVQTRSKTPEK